MTPQEKFDATYVTSREICERCNVDPATLTMWKALGKFPTESIIVGKRIKLWVRSDVEIAIHRKNYERRHRA